MAIQTGNSGTYNISTENQYISGYVQWVETYDDETYITTNKTTVTQTAYLHRTNIYADPTSLTNVPGQRSMYFDEADESNYDNLYLSIPGNSSPSGGEYAQVYSANHEILHEDNGSKNIDLGFYMTNTLSGAAGNAFRVSKTTSNVDLMNIPRYATVTTTTSNVKENSVDVAWSSDANVDTIRYRLNNGDWVTVESDVDKNSGSYTITGLQANTSYTIDFDYKRKDSQLWSFDAGYSGSSTILTLPNVCYIKVNNSWKQATPYIKVNGTWKAATPYIKVNGTWKAGIS